MSRAVLGFAFIVAALARISFDIVSTFTCSPFRKAPEPRSPRERANRQADFHAQHWQHLRLVHRIHRRWYACRSAVPCSSSLPLAELKVPNLKQGEQPLNMLGCIGSGKKRSFTYRFVAVSSYEYARIAAPTLHLPLRTTTSTQEVLLV